MGTEVSRWSLMVAGRELDALVAEKVMGMELLPLKEAPCPYCGDEMRFCGERSRCTTCGEWRYSPAKEYSTDIAAAWEVVEKLKAGGFSLIAEWDAHDEMWYVVFSNVSSYKAGEADAAPHAICLVALAAVGAPVTPGEDE